MQRAAGEELSVDAAASALLTFSMWSRRDGKQSTKAEASGRCSRCASAGRTTEGERRRTKTQARREFGSC